MYFLISSIAIGWSTLPRVHASSQRRLQIAPQTAGNGLSCLISLRASINLPSEAIFTYPCTAKCAGQAVLHGAVPVS